METIDALSAVSGSYIKSEKIVSDNEFVKVTGHCGVEVVTTNARRYGLLPSASRLDLFLHSPDKWTKSVSS